MFFKEEDIERLPDYGNVIDADVFMERVEEMIKSKLVFEADYIYRDVVRVDKAEDFLVELYRVLKNL